MNEEVRDSKEQQDGIDLVKEYEDLFRDANKEIINIVGKQGELLERFRDEDEFFDRVWLSRSNISFKISLYKFLRKFPLLKNWTLTSSYFKTNFEANKKVRKLNVNIFAEESKKLILLFFIFFVLVWIVLENFIHWKSFLVCCREFYRVWRTLSSVENFIECGEFYPVWRILSSVEYFISNQNSEKHPRLKL